MDRATFRRNAVCTRFPAPCPAPPKRPIRSSWDLVSVFLKAVAQALKVHLEAETASTRLGARVFPAGAPGLVKSWWRNMGEPVPHLGLALERIST